MRQPLEGPECAEAEGGQVKKFVALAFAAAALIGAGLFAFTEPAQILVRFSTPTELYQGRALVTGQRDETRIPGFERALADVTRKLTGDSGLNAAAVIKALNAPVQDYVAAYTETDRMADIPIHDEQGTRDRPFELLVTFKPAKIDSLVKSMGRTPWRGSRPRILVLLQVVTDQGAYMLTDDGDRGIDQRDALHAAAWTAGLPIVLPTQAQRDAGSSPDVIARKTNPGRILQGQIVWKSDMKGWQAEWTLLEGDALKTWHMRDVNFDEAFRNAMRGTASILSGHGVIAESES
jgi:uncharacterized protein